MQQRSRGIASLLGRIKGFQQATYATDSRAGSAAGEFWSSVQVKDLPDSSPELEIARRHNSSLPYRPEQLIQGSIVHVDKDHVTIDTGHPVRTSFAKRELHVRQLVRSRDTGVRTNAQDFRIGDILHFMLEELITPFGDIGLRVYRPSDKDRLRLIWEELAQHHAAQMPVKGRFLNSIYGGYSIGIAGVVGMLPERQVQRNSFKKKIGSLQEFFITELDFATQTLVLCDRQFWLQDRRKGKQSNRIKSQTQNLVNVNLKAKDTIGKAQVLALVAAAKSSSAGKPSEAAVPATLQGALELCETEQQLNKDQAFQMLQDLKQEARPEVFNAVWTKMQNWGFDFKGLVLDGVPVVDPRRMVELQSAKPVQTIGWQAPSKAEAQRTEAGTLGSQSGAATTDGSSEVQTPPGQDDQAKKSATGEQDSTDPAKPRVYTAHLDDEYWDR